MAKKVTKQSKVTKRHGDFIPPVNTGRVALEREYFEDIILTDPDTGQKKLHKKVKIKRYKTLSSLPSTRIVGSSENDLDGDDSLDGYGDEGSDE